jgi:hypothetical protein
VIAGVVGFGAVFLRRNIEVQEKRFIINAAVLDEVLTLTVLLRQARYGLANVGALIPMITDGLEANMARFDAASDYIVYLQPMKRASEVAGWFREVRMLRLGLVPFVIPVGSKTQWDQPDRETLAKSIDLIDALVERGDAILRSYGVDRRKLALEKGWKPEDL